MVYEETENKFLKCDLSQINKLEYMEIFVKMGKL